MSDELLTPEAFKRSVNHAKYQIDLANEAIQKNATPMAELLVGNLRHVSESWHGRRTLAILKRELQEFDAKTRKWKS